jgi:5-methylcytosine-specific restriction endonuclease McrA
MNDTLDAAFWAPRRCLREPIPDLWDVALLLNRAVDAHLAGDRGLADALLRDANRPSVREWTESLWGSAKANPNQWQFRRVRPVAGSPPHLPKAERVQQRKPSAVEQAAIIAQYGRHCVFCGVPLIRSEVRGVFHRFYPEAVPWGSTNQSQHAAFQALWLQFDHLLPHSQGGDNSLTNVVVTCAGCNYGRMNNTLEELGLIDPRSRIAPDDTWDGLERVLTR